MAAPRFNLNDTHCFIMDLDGTVYVGARPISGTVAFITALSAHKQFYFVSNNTSKTPDDYVARLRALGIPTDSAHIVTPLEPLITYLRANALTRVCLLANTKVTAHLQAALPELELTHTPSGCEAVVVTYDTDLTYDKLKNAALVLQHEPEVPLLATHRDRVCPTEEGAVPDSGCILAVLELTTGRTPAVVFGKPNPHLVARITDRYDPSRIAMVGDRLYTDKRLADAIGCAFICVLSGETTRAQVERLADDERPALIVEDLGEVLSEFTSR
ncbi:MAG: HAD-IIA family hydrolase [Halobacteriota archaeon]